MSVLRRRLLMGGGRGRYVDDFAALSGRWVAQAGSLAVSSGALQAATLGDWLNNLITNGELTTNTDGWAESRTTISRVDSGSDPGANSGGNDKWALKAVKTDTVSWASALYTFAAIIGAQYSLSGRGYAPSSNTAVNAAAIGSRSTAGFASTVWDGLTAEDVWQSLRASGLVATSVGPQLFLLVDSAKIGDTAYIDAAAAYRCNAPALLAGWRSPNHVATLSHVSPAAGVVPFGYICRYMDSLNYWEVRVLPNTAGNDLQIIQVTDGVETTRAEADVDWTSDDTDELMVDCRGSTIATYHRKSGASVWTAGPSYASATQGQTSPDVGVMLYQLGVGRLSGFEIRAL